MNKNEVIAEVEKIGSHFNRIMHCLCSNEYVVGYNRAINDIVHHFRYAPHEEDFAEERNRLRQRVGELEQMIISMERKLQTKDNTIDTMLKYIDIFDFVDDCRRNGNRKQGV